MPERTATINRETKETQISLSINLDGSGDSEIDTGVGFLDHMLTHIARHGMFDLTVEATGDYEVDDHHTVEDVGICFGRALAEAVGDKRGIVRYGSFICPMDEALVTVALDLSGRPFTNCDLDLQASRVGSFDTELVTEFFRAVASNAAMTLHVSKQYGHNTHHLIEAAFKAFGRALDRATSIDPRREDDVPSTKGTL
ncbi:MAG: imidazoleglycerol-phosphate dehydratase HisB [Armatimonadota bacterium]